MFNIYVGNMSFDTTESELHDLFASHGTVERVNIVTDRDTGRPRGFGFVEMQEESDGQNAIEALNGTEVGGRVLTVNQAKPRAPRGGGDRRRY